MEHERYLTKSLFRLGIDCPAKLFYSGKPDEYPDKNNGDTFLARLAEGGIQVGALAQYFHSNGVEVDSRDPVEALDETIKLLNEGDTTLYEAAFAYKGLYARVDILVKKGNQLELIEVKSKSYDTLEKPALTKKSGATKTEWRKHLYDISFQKYVIQNAYPEYSVSASLLLVNKHCFIGIEGLHQAIRVIHDQEGRASVAVDDSLDLAGVAQQMLVKIPVNEEVDLIIDGLDDPIHGRSFVRLVEDLKHSYSIDKILIPTPPVSSRCTACQFRATDEETKMGKNDGFKECWKAALGWNDRDFEEHSILKLWNFTGKDKLLAEGKVLLKDVTPEDIAPKSDGKPGLSKTQRQWLQVKKEVDRDRGIWVDDDSLSREMDQWTYPLHFIDFETASPIIPFSRGRKPQELNAFQFSHHVVHSDGSVAHFGEYLNTQRGEFANYDFLRELKKQLAADSGTIFRYASHENTVLGTIYRQIENERVEPLPDKDELLEFIREISHGKYDGNTWSGSRDMIDMRELVLRYFYAPETLGSNSIKDVLPAMLNASSYLQRKYSQPIYGSENGTSSRNFKDWTWVIFDGDRVLDPYQLLLRQPCNETGSAIADDFSSVIHNGGEAMMAYAGLQYEDINPLDEEAIRESLLRYCELDTMAMVMIYEGWRELLTARKTETEF